MPEHFCQWIVDFNMDEEGDPIFCDKPAGIKLDGEWLCAQHYDIFINLSQAKNRLDKLSGV